MRRLGTLATAAVTTAALLSAGCGGESETETFRVPSGSMEPTFGVGDEVKYAQSRDVAIGDVIVFHPPSGADTNECASGEGPFYVGPKARVLCSRATAGESSSIYFKRVVAVGGDQVGIEDGRTVLNGQRQDEPFIKACGATGADCNLDTITVPEGSVFVLGDNRGASDDSRYWGPLRTAAILGVVED